MIFLPLPFVVTLFLLILLLQTLSRGEAEEGANRLFPLLIGAYALQSVLVGLRWGYDVRAALPLMSTLASMIAPLTWLFFRTLTSESMVASGRGAWPHFLPAGLLVLMLVLWRAPIGPFIILLYLGYGIALLWLARRGPDVLLSSRLDGVVRSYRALQITGIALVGSAITDVLISFDIARSGGIHAGFIVSVSDGFVLLALGAAVAVAGMGAATMDESSEPGGKPVSADMSPEEVTETVAAIDAAMCERGLFRDAELNLAKLARRMGLPARQVSNAINRRYGMSVSQYVNGYRVRTACDLLVVSDEPVSTVMFEAGFMTKSNFNREFLRVTGTSPSAWRKSHRREARNPGGGRADERAQN